MLKSVSALIPTCICGRAMRFKANETISFCRTPGCGVVLERVREGYWAYGRSRVAFTPILPMPKVQKGVKSRDSKYINYPKSSRKKNGRKNVKARC